MLASIATGRVNHFPTNSDRMARLKTLRPVLSLLPEVAALQYTFNMNIFLCIDHKIAISTTHTKNLACLGNRMNRLYPVSLDHQLSPNNYYSDQLPFLTFDLCSKRTFNFTHTFTTTKYLTIPSGEAPILVINKAHAIHCL